MTNICYNFRERTYTWKQKVGAQTIKMEFTEINHHPEVGIVDYNIYVCVYTKRKHETRNYNEIRSTGKNPLLIATTGLKMYKEMEKRVIADENYHDWKVRLVVTWTDNRRRNAYMSVLTRLGYKIDMYDGKKSLIKHTWEVK